MGYSGVPWEGSKNITHDFRTDRGNGAGSSRLQRDLTGEEGVAVRAGNRIGRCGTVMT